LNAGYPPYGLHGTAQQLAALEAEGRPVAIVGRYHGQWTFDGRLRRPLAQIDPAAVGPWLAGHPGGRVLMTLRDAQAAPPGLLTMVATDEGSTLTGFGDWYGAYPALDAGVETDPDATALQLYSSGTTGLPKGVELSHRAMAHSHVNGVSQEWAYDPLVHVNLNVLPAFHIAGAGVALMTHAFGGRSITMPDRTDRAGRCRGSCWPSWR
jgi:acyl-CoA synthetase (AMP-forming)/AMP-acid ligase II